MFVWFNENVFRRFAYCEKNKNGRYKEMVLMFELC